MMLVCEMCGERFELPARGRSGRFCSGACRQRAYRARRRSSVPAVMRSERRWVRAVGKRPVMPDGRSASSTDSSTWGSWSSVQRGAGDGFGFMLGGGFACHDLDHCFAGGVLSPWAAEVVRGIPVGDVLFAERSVSGDGLHVFVRAAEGRGCRSGGHEFYSRWRFIRVTGDVVDLGGLVPPR